MNGLDVDDDTKTDFLSTLDSLTPFTNIDTTTFAFSIKFNTVYYANDVNVEEVQDLISGFTNHTTGLINYLSSP